jgi:hypothetical protein
VPQNRKVPAAAEGVGPKRERDIGILQLREVLLDRALHQSVRIERR